MLVESGVVGLEDKIELEVDEANGLELLVGGRVKLVDDDTELGEGDANEVRETIDGGARVRRGERSEVHSVSRSVSRRHVE